MPRKRRTEPPQAIHWIRDPATIEVLASPLRQRLLDRLESRGPCSVRELADALGRRPDALYYHVKLLIEHGLIREVEQRATGTSPESVYDLCHRRWHIAYEPDDPQHASALAKVTKQVLRAAAQDFAAGLDHADARGRGPTRNLWSLRLEAHLDEAEQRALVGHLEAIVALLRKPKRGRTGQLTALTWVLAPLGDPTDPPPDP